jgi:hypothetical protein
MIGLAAPSFEQSALMLAWIAIVLLAFAMSGLMRQIHAVTRAIQGGRSLVAGPTTGLLAPRIPQLDGSAESVLLFVEPGCSSCDHALTTVTHAAAGSTDDRAYVVLYRDSAPENGERPGLTTLSHASRVFDALNVAITPTIVILNERRRVAASAPVGSPEVLEELMPYIRGGRTADDPAS